MVSCLLLSNRRCEVSGTIQASQKSINASIMMQPYVLCLVHASTCVYKLNLDKQTNRQHSSQNSDISSTSPARVSLTRTPGSSTESAKSRTSGSRSRSSTALRLTESKHAETFTHQCIGAQAERASSQASIDVPRIHVNQSGTNETIDLAEEEDVPATDAPSPSPPPLPARRVCSLDFMPIHLT